jgi:hypothetical protein
MKVAPVHLVYVALVTAGLLAARPSQAYKETNPCGYCSNPTLSQGNGKAQHPEVVLIFWQDSGTQQWSSNSNSPTMSQYIGYLNQLVNSAYTAGLNQYAGSGGFIARPRFSGWAPTYTGTSPLGHTSFRL